MTVAFRPAITSEAKPLIGLYGESGSGKTWSALLLARGFAGPDAPIGMIETEGGRGEAYADLIPGGYDVLPLRGDYSPGAYGEAIEAAEAAHLRVLIIDSASHEWEGVGGVLDMAANNLAAGKKSVLVWQGPKMLHQRHFMGRLISTPIPIVIVCMRARYPMKESMKDGKKEWVRSDTLEPIQSESILSEMFVQGHIDKQHRFHVGKITRPDFAAIFPDGQPITTETGQRLAAWAAGHMKPTAEAPITPPDPDAMRAATLTAIEIERKKIGASPGGWAKVVAYFCASGQAHAADIIELDDLLAFARKLAAKDPEALAVLDQKILKRSAA